MFWGNNAKVDMLKEMIGTPDEYKKTIERSHFTNDEKDIIITAVVQLKKHNYSSKIMDQAYDILFGSATQSNNHENNTSTSTKKTTQEKAPIEPKQDEQKAYNAKPEDLDDDIYGFKDD